MATVWHSNEARQYCSIQASRAEHSRTIFIKAGYVLLHQLDLLLTVSAVSVGLFELNPVIRNLLATPIQLVVVKLVIPLFIAWLVPSKLLLPAIAFLSLVVIWNMKELLVLLF